MGLIRLCPGCGNPFEASRPNQVRCRRNCGNHGAPHSGGHGARSRKTALHDLRFVAIDGEGITREDGRHDYVLLSCGKFTLHHDGARLGFNDIATFLWECREADPGAAYVGFYLGYDFAQWLKDLPKERAWRLLSNAGIATRKRRAAHLPPFPVRHDGWEFDILPMRRFKLRPEGEEGWLTVCDVGPFFQTSFLAAIDPAKSLDPIVTPAEYELIKRGKEARGSAEFNPAMIEYNLLECDVLARLMRQQNAGLVGEGIKLKRSQWIGPGQAAQQWLNNIKAPKGEAIREAVPQNFRDAARQAYFGGWFEIFHHGPAPGAAYGYDINSAYPYVMAQLPCLLHGRVTRKAWEGPKDLMLIKARVTGSHPLIGAMLHRTRKKTVLRPRQTEGWFWWHELQLAKAAGFIDRIDEIDWLTFERRCNCPPPLAPIAELYKGRLAVGKNTPNGRAKRLIYNSAYGKFAQSVGEPAYGNPVYASLITANTRCMIIEAISSHPDPASLLMVATDSVTFAAPHPGLPLDGQQLGAWTEHKHEGLSLFMPGVYWDDDTRDRLRRGEDPALKSRGISASDIAKRLAVIDRAWTRFARDGWPRLMIPVRFQLVSPRQALARRKWQLCGSVVTSGRRIISADPKGKRVGLGAGRSLPYAAADDIASYPYDGTFGDEMSEFADTEFGDHPDGPIGSVIMPALLR
jgi:hypothetical protein